MDSEVISALIGALTAAAGIGLVHLLKILATKRERASEINSSYLNPLRLYCEETYNRLRDIRNRSDGHGRCEILLYVDDPKELSQKNAHWYNGEGCYLVSSCYFTACLFACINKARERIPYLRLRSKDDTVLLNRMFTVSRTFLQELGVFYAIQHSIGSEVWRQGQECLMTYKEFCEHLMDEEKRVWFDRLIVFYIQTGKGEHPDRVEKALGALRELGQFVDKAVQGGDSMGARSQSEGESARRA